MAPFPKNRVRNNYLAYTYFYCRGGSRPSLIMSEFDSVLVFSENILRIKEYGVTLQSIAKYGRRTAFQLFKYKTEILGVGKTGNGGNLFDTQAAVDQKIRSVVDAQNLQVFDGRGLIDLVEIAAELGVGKIGDLTQGGNGHLRVCKMLMHIIQRVFDGQKCRGVVDGGALFVQLCQNGVEHGHALVIIARAFERPGLVNGLKVFPEYRGVLRGEKLRLEVFQIGNIQIDTQNNFLLGFDVVGAARGDKEN